MMRSFLSNIYTYYIRLFFFFEKKLYSQLENIMFSVDGLHERGSAFLRD